MIMIYFIDQSIITLDRATPAKQFLNKHGFSKVPDTISQEIKSKVLMEERVSAHCNKAWLQIKSEILHNTRDYNSFQQVKD